MAAAPFCVVARERAANIAVLPGKSGQNLGSLFPRRFSLAGAGVAVSSPYPTALLNKPMAPIPEVVDAVERSLRLSREEALTFVAGLIKTTDIWVEIYDNGTWIAITENQRRKTRVGGGRVKTGVDAEIVRLTLITSGFDAESESSHPDRVSAPTKTPPKPGPEPKISTHRVYEAVQRCLEADGIMAGNAPSPARLKAGRPPIHNHRKLCAAFVVAGCYGKGINIPNQSIFIKETKDVLVQIFGYTEEDSPGDTMFKQWASEIIKAISASDKKHEDEEGR